MPGSAGRYAGVVRASRTELADLGIRLGLAILYPRYVGIGAVYDLLPKAVFYPRIISRR